MKFLDIKTDERLLAEKATDAAIGNLVLLTCVLFLTIFGCALFQPSAGGTDLAALADDVELYRQDVQDVAVLATPETYGKLLELDAAVVKVAAALRVVAAGGAGADLRAAVSVALAIADELDLDDDGDLRFAIAALKIALRHAVASFSTEQ